MARAVVMKSSAAINCKKIVERSILLHHICHKCSDIWHCQPLEFLHPVKNQRELYNKDAANRLRCLFRLLLCTLQLLTQSLLDILIFLNWRMISPQLFAIFKLKCPNRLQSQGSVIWWSIECFFLIESNAYSAFYFVLAPRIWKCCWLPNIFKTDQWLLHGCSRYSS